MEGKSLGLGDFVQARMTKDMNKLKQLNEWLKRDFLLKLAIALAIEAVLVTALYQLLHSGH